MKHFFKAVLCFALLASATAPVEAQGLNGLLKKGEAAVKKGKKVVKEGKEAVSKVLGNEKEDAENPYSVGTTPVKPKQAPGNGSSEIEVINPVSEFIEIEPIGLYGVSKSENYGDAYLALRVKKLIPQDITRFGSGVVNKKMIAVDPNGKVYNIDASGQYGYDTPEGLVVRVILDEPGLMFTDIKKDVDMMQQVKIGVFSDAYHQGNVTFNNVPIFWDEEPE